MLDDQAKKETSEPERRGEEPFGYTKPCDSASTSLVRIKLSPSNSRATQFEKLQATSVKTQACCVSLPASLSRRSKSNRPIFQTVPVLKCRTQ